MCVLVEAKQRRIKVTDCALRHDQIGDRVAVPEGALEFAGNHLEASPPLRDNAVTRLFSCWISIALPALCFCWRINLRAHGISAIVLWRCSMARTSLIDL